MGKILVASFLSVLASFSSLAVKPAAVDSVFICTGSSARTYHTDRSCKGLVKCGGKVVSLPASVVLKKKRLCKKCEAQSEDLVVPAMQKSGKAKAKPKEKTKKAARKKKLSYPTRCPLTEPCD